MGRSHGGLLFYFFNETFSGKFRKILKEQVYSKEQTAYKFVEKSVNGRVL